MKKRILSGTVDILYGADTAACFGIGGTGK